MGTGFFFRPQKEVNTHNEKTVATTLVLQEILLTWLEKKVYLQMYKIDAEKDISILSLINLGTALFLLILFWHIMKLN